MTCPLPRRRRSRLRALGEVVAGQRPRPARVHQRAHAQVGDLERHAIGVVPAQVLGAREALDVTVAHQLVHFLAFQQVEHEIALPSVRAQAQRHDGVVGQLRLVLQAGDAPVGVDDRLRGGAILAGLAGGQLFDDRPSLDVGLLLVEAALDGLRGDQRHRERRQQHGDHDDARQEQQQLALGYGERDGEHSRPA